MALLLYAHYLRPFSSQRREEELTGQAAALSLSLSVYVYISLVGKRDLEWMGQGRRLAMPVLLPTYVCHDMRWMCLHVMFKTSEKTSIGRMDGHGWACLQPPSGM